MPVVAGAVVLALAGCGGGGGTKQSVTAATTTTRPAPSFRIEILAATHRPRANAKWPVTIRVVDAAGKPLAARLKMQIVFGGSPVGSVDNGRVYRFTGTWREQPGHEITWPKAAVGQPLTFRAVVTAAGRTRSADYAIDVRR